MTTQENNHFLVTMTHRVPFTPIEPNVAIICDKKTDMLFMSWPYADDTTTVIMDPHTLDFSEKWWEKICHGAVQPSDWSDIINHKAFGVTVGPCGDESTDYCDLDVLINNSLRRLLPAETRITAVREKIAQRVLTEKTNNGWWNPTKLGGVTVNDFYVVDTVDNRLYRCVIESSKIMTAPAKLQPERQTMYRLYVMPILSHRSTSMSIDPGNSQ